MQWWPFDIDIDFYTPWAFCVAFALRWFFSPVFYVPTYLRMDSAALVDL